jgi:inhibitor of KinA sporulation pathway (predicted exonuclease)
LVVPSGPLGIPLGFSSAPGLVARAEARFQRLKALLIDQCDVSHFCGFVRPSHFHELSEELSAATKCRQAAFKSPKFPMLYTNPTVKANPLGRGTAM